MCDEVSDCCGLSAGKMCRIIWNIIFFSSSQSYASVQVLALLFNYGSKLLFVIQQHTTISQILRQCCELFRRWCVRWCRTKSNEILLWQVMVWDVEIDCVHICVCIVLFADVPWNIIAPRHYSKPKEWLPGKNQSLLCDLGYLSQWILLSIHQSWYIYVPENLKGPSRIASRSLIFHRRLNAGCRRMTLVWTQNISVFDRLWASPCHSHQSLSYTPQADIRHQTLQHTQHRK